MLRVIALVATVAAAGTLAGTASAHPPDLYDSSYGTAGYGTTYTQPSYASTSYSQPYYGSTYSTSAYVAPSYTGTTYSGTSYKPTYNATPIYTKSYRGSSYSGYTTPNYGYRHKAARPYYGGHGKYGTVAHDHRGTGYGYYGYVRNSYYDRPLPSDRHRSFGPYSEVPTTEGLNVGYAGGPTFGTDSNPVINGVQLNAAPD